MSTFSVVVWLPTFVTVCRFGSFDKSTPMFLVENDVCVGTKGCKKAGVVGLAVAGVLVLLETAQPTMSETNTTPPAIAISGCISIKPTRLSCFGSLALTFLVAD